MTTAAPQLHDIEVTDVEYLQHGDAPLLARMYLPRGPGPFPLVIDVHGGAWCRGDRLDEDTVSRALACQGIAVAALDFRMPPAAGYPASLADLNFAIRWLKSDAARWHTRPHWVGVLGLSSGAHQAILAAMRPRDARYPSIALPAGPGPDARVAFAVLCWPVIDPLGRYRFARQWRASGQPYPEAVDRVLPDHDRYWGSEEAMAEGNPLRALERGEPVELPPVLYLQGEQDLIHPREHAERFVAAYRQAGGALDLRIYPGEDAAFIIKKPDAPATAQAIRDIAAFVQAQCRR